MRATLLWGAMLSLGVARFYFGYGPGQMHINHEGVAYVSRVVEFLACLRAGYPFPEWAVDFRGGLGSPYFGYYQPGFFYVASVFASWMRPEPALGATVAAFAFLGYVGMLALVGQRFGTAGGTLAATTLLLFPYSMVELYIRGDLSEYAGMMLLPGVLHCATVWMERASRVHWLVMALGCGVLVVMHPAAALLGYGVLGLAIGGYALGTRSALRGIGAVAALLVGGALAAFFWLPVAVEWTLVQGDLATTDAYSFLQNFINPRALAGPGASRGVPLAVGRTVPALIAAVTVLLVAKRRAVAGAQWRLVAVAWLAGAVSVWMMMAASRPVWDVLPLLHRIQFPWRFMLVLTVAAAALSGCAPTGARALAVIGIAAQVWITMKIVPLRLQYEVFATPADIAGSFVRPDIADEWLPRGTKAFGGAEVPRVPRCSTPECYVDRFERESGRLRVQVTTPTAGFVTLPHYFFPVGWRGTVNGAPVGLTPTEDGLVRVPVSDGVSLIELTFRMTPVRRLAAGVSALTLTALVVAAGAKRRRAHLTGRAPAGTSS